MAPNRIAILMPGDMGHAVGRVLREHGHDVVSCLGGRSERTCKLAMTAGIRDTESLAGLVSQVDMIWPERVRPASIQMVCASAGLGGGRGQVCCGGRSLGKSIPSGNSHSSEPQLQVCSWPGGAAAVSGLSQIRGEWFRNREGA